MLAVLNIFTFPRPSHDNIAWELGQTEIFFNEVGVTANKQKAELTGLKAIRQIKEKKRRGKRSSVDNFWYHSVSVL